MSEAVREKNEDSSAVRIIRRFSSIKVNFEKDKRKTISKFQQQGLRVSVTPLNFSQDKKEIRKKLRVSIERYSMPELYVKMVCALFPGSKSRENPDSKALIQHLKLVFRLNDLEHIQLMDIAKTTKLPQRIVNLEIVEAKGLPAMDANGLSDPYCVVFVNTRDVAQRTKVIYNSLDPVWREYFTFKVNDISKDVLILEVMDFNEEDEPLKEKIKRLKDIKSPSTLKILLKEIANARSGQELIGTLKIPVSDISSETIERPFKLKNHEDRGELYLRMALGYNKSKEAATEEFLQIIHFLIVHELDSDSSLGTPFYWDEHYNMWSKYILRQFKWQGALKPKDIVLAKWRAYTTINEIFPLNANMLHLLLRDVMKRIISGECDPREITRFWTCTESLVKTIMAFLTDLHDVLPCPVTILHTYHMLKTIEALNEFLCDTTVLSHKNIPFTKPCIIDSVVRAVENGANKFYIKVISDATHDNITPGQDPLILALERLLKMGQILHEDLRLGINTIHADFIGILGVDYLGITYKIYDEQYGKMVKYIVEEYNSKLLDPIDADIDGDDTMDENSLTVQVGLSVFKLYLAVKNLAELAPANYKDKNMSEFSLKHGFHSWFFHSVATWIDILRNKIIKMVKNSIDIAEGAQSLYQDMVDSKLIVSITNKQETRDIPISSSAVDTARMFHEIQIFWLSLDWQDEQQSYIIVRKILEELYGYLIYYAAELYDSMVQHEHPSDLISQQNIESQMRKTCTAVNNIGHVKGQVEELGKKLKIHQIIDRIKALKTNIDCDEYEDKIHAIKIDMEEQVSEVITKIMRRTVKLILPRFNQLLQVSSDILLAKSDAKSKRLSVNRFRELIDYIDNCLSTFNSNLECQNFRHILEEIWHGVVQALEKRLQFGIQTGKSPEYFQRLNDLVFHLFNCFWPREIEVDMRTENPALFEEFDALKSKLADMELTLEELTILYYEQRQRRQQMTPVACHEHGIVTIRACMMENSKNLVVELLNARNLKGYDSNGLSDPYATLKLVPEEVFPNGMTHRSKTHKQSLFPLFEESFIFAFSEEDFYKKGFLLISLYDYDFLGRDDLIGEAILSTGEIAKLNSADEIGNLSQTHLVLCKPNDTDVDLLKKIENRFWDKEAVRFSKRETDKMK